MLNRWNFLKTGFYEGIKPHSYYSWTKEFMESGKERLTRDSVRDATQHEVGQLKRENGNSRS